MLWFVNPPLAPLPSEYREAVTTRKLDCGKCLKQVASQPKEACRYFVLGMGVG